MYPKNIKSKKISKTKTLKVKLKIFKDEFIEIFKYLWRNRKQLNKILLVKLHI